MKKETGFSLIELLIVVAIIGIIAAIAIPNLLKSRQAANEASAIGSVRSIGTAQATYQATNGQGVNFADDLATLGPAPAGVGAIDAALASGVKSGFNFATASNNGVTPRIFDTAGSPQAVGSFGTGNRSFYSNESFVIYQQDGLVALAAWQGALTNRIPNAPAVPIQ